MTDKIETHVIRELMNDWRSKVKVSLTEDAKEYVVTGDERVPADVTLPRVTGILNIIEKQGLRTWAMDMALEHIREEFRLFQHKHEPSRRPTFPLDRVLIDARQAHEQKRDTAADFGTEAHALLQQLYLDPDTAVPDEFRTVVDSWDKWMTESGLEVIATEQQLYYHDSTSRNSPVSFAGTADLIAVDSNGIPVVCDYKTGSRIYAEYSLQMAAYTLALTYCGIGNFLNARDASLTRAFVVRLPKEEGKDIEVKEVNDVLVQQEAFIHACKLRQWQSGRSKWVRNPKR